MKAKTMKTMITSGCLVAVWSLPLCGEEASAISRVSDHQKSEELKEARQELYKSFNSFLSAAGGNYRQALRAWKEANQEAFEQLAEEEALLAPEEAPVLERGEDPLPEGAKESEKNRLRQWRAEIKALTEQSSALDKKERYRQQREIMKLHKKQVALRERIERREQKQANALLESPTTVTSVDAELEAIKGLDTVADRQQIRELLRARAQRLEQERQQLESQSE